MNPIRFDGSNRVALFVDGDNFYGTLAGLGWQVDFIKLREALTKDCPIYNCFYYTSWDEDQKKRNFAIFLLNNGFSVRRRDQQRIMKGGKLAMIKGDTDVLMVVDMMATKDNYDTAVLVTGDGDFVPVVEFLRTHGKRIIAVSSKFESASIDLVNSVDRFIDLSEIKGLIERVVDRTEVKVKESPDKRNPETLLLGDRKAPEGEVIPDVNGDK